MLRIPQSAAELAGENPLAALLSLVEELLMAQSHLLQIHEIEVGETLIVFAGNKHMYRKYRCWARLAGFEKAFILFWFGYGER